MSEQDKLVKEPQVVYVQQPNYGDVSNDDEIDLGALFGILWAGRNLIIGITALFAILAVVYVKAIVKPIYVTSFPVYAVSEAELLLVQPPENIDKTMVPFLSADLLFRQLSDRFSTESWKKKFWLEKKQGKLELLLEDGEFSALLGNVKFSAAVKKNNTPAKITLESDKPSVLAEISTGYLQFLETELLSELVEQQQLSIENALFFLNSQIGTLKETNEVALNDQYIRAQENFAIAKKLGFSDPYFEKLANIDGSLANNRYLLGTKVLQAEIEGIKARQGNDAYVSGLRGLEAQLLALNSYQLRFTENIQKVRAVDTPDVVDVPLKPSKPNKLLICILAVILGGMFSVFTVFIRHAVKSYKAKETQV